ncbi:MAG: glutathione S-transferase N-terminal domain-containing protein [Rhizonema sp. PD38]|nr:glutathione S-transferase N-terminal domain-containing protein [Rhizonema sp. PD38]
MSEPYELQQVKSSDPEYLKVNPLNQVPAMIDGDNIVTNQADTIWKYLAHKYPDVKLGNDGKLQNA